MSQNRSTLMWKVKVIMANGDFNVRTSEYSLGGCQSNFLYFLGPKVNQLELIIFLIMVIRQN